MYMYWATSFIRTSQVIRLKRGIMQIRLEGWPCILICFFSPLYNTPITAKAGPHIPYVRITMIITASNRIEYQRLIVRRLM